MFVLCDAGGGTVDLISYKITRVDPYLEVEEAAVGSGDKCGASYIDKVRTLISFNHPSSLAAHTRFRSS